MTHHRFFQGCDTRQVSLSGAPALPDSWYYEPNDYNGDMLWSFAYETREAAQVAAEREAEWIEVTEVNS